MCLEMVAIANLTTGVPSLAACPTKPRLFRPRPSDTTVLLRGHALILSLIAASRSGKICFMTARIESRRYEIQLELATCRLIPETHDHCH